MSLDCSRKLRKLERLQEEMGGGGLVSNAEMKAPCQQTEQELQNKSGFCSVSPTWMVSTFVMSPQRSSQSHGGEYFPCITVVDTKHGCIVTFWLQWCLYSWDMVLPFSCFRKWLPERNPFSCESLSLRNVSSLSSPTTQKIWKRNCT